MSGKARNFCATINNYDDADVERVRRVGSDEATGYLVVGFEVGESGTPHLQIYVEFKNARSFTAICKLIGGHVEIRKGTAKQASDYCKKDGKFEEFGTIKNPNGKRKDYDTIKASVIEGKSITNMLLDDEINDPFTLKFAENIKKYLGPKRNWECKIIWLYGPTGTGKSKWVYEYLADKDFYTCLDDAKFMDGYDGQPYIWIDDIRGDFCKFHTMLKFADRYPMRLNTKGSSTQLLAKEILITAPGRPETIWKTVEDYGQLYRRIGRIIEFTSNGTVEQAARVIIDRAAELQFDV